MGKTYILKEFGRNEFDNMIYINCYKNSSIIDLFSGDVDVDRLLLGLSALGGGEIKPEKTLVFLDEVQEVPNVVAALKYFCERAPRVCVAVAGSLLGVLNMAGISFPTGKVDILHLYPMDFNEFMIATGESRLLSILESPEQIKLTNSLSAKYIELLRRYYYVGGMPEAVDAFVRTGNLEKVRQVQNDILSAYEADIAKHAGADTLRARMVFQSIPSQLARENKKFVFGALRKGARAGEFEKAIQWLVDAGLVYKVNRLSRVALPLNFYEDTEAFKLFLLDVGLLGAMSQTPASLVLIGNNIFSEYKGAFTENYVMTQLVASRDVTVGYYTKENSTMEIDFVVQAGSHLMPVEVKAEENVRSKSLRQLVTVDNSGTGMHGYRFSMRGYEEQSWLTSVPLYAVKTYVDRKSAQDRLTKI